MKTFTRSDGVRLRYLDDGEGMPVLLMPGAQGTHDVYDPQVPPLLEAGYRVVRLDREGRGQSDWGEFRFTGVGEARDAWAILDTLGIKRAVLVGRSSGSGVIRQMYLTRPERVIALVSIDSDSFGKFHSFRPPAEPDDAGSDPDADSGLDPRFDPETVAAYHRNKRSLQKIDALWDYPSDFNTKARTEWFDERLRIEAELDKRPENPAEQNVAKPPPGSEYWCQVPLLVFAAGRGRAGPGDPESVELKKRLPAEHAVLVVVKNSGHWVNVEALALFNRELLAFLERVRQEQS